MTKVAIIGGAGTLGSSAAFNIAVQGLADEIVLIDIRQNVATHHAADIQTAIVGRQNTVVRAGIDEDLAGSDIVIMAAGATPRLISSRMEYLSENIPIILRVKEKIELCCPSAIVITTANPADILNYALYKRSTLERQKLIGYTLNDTLRFCQAIAEALKIKSTEVDAMVIGEHGDNQVLLFSSIKVDGKPFPVDEDFKRDIRARVPNLLREYKALKAGRTSGWTSGVGLAKIVHAIVNDTKEVLPCSVVLAGEYGYTGLSMSVPAIIGEGGIHQIFDYELVSDEKEQLENSVNIIKSGIRHLEEVLGSEG